MQIRSWTPDAPASPFQAAVSRKLESSKAWVLNQGGRIAGFAPGAPSVRSEMKAALQAIGPALTKSPLPATAPAVSFEAMGKPSLNLNKAYVSSPVEPFRGVRGEMAPGVPAGQVETALENALKSGQKMTCDVAQSPNRPMGSDKNRDMASLKPMPPVMNERDRAAAAQLEQDFERHYLLPIPRSGVY